MKQNRTATADVVELYDPINTEIIQPLLASLTQLPSHIDIDLSTTWSRRELLLGALALVLLAYFLYNQYINLNSLMESLSSYFSSPKLDARKVSNGVQALTGAFAQRYEIADPKFQSHLPPRAWKDKYISKKLDDFGERELEVKRKGMYSGSLHSTSTTLMEVSKEAVGNFLFTDMINLADHSPSRQIENEVASMVLNLFNPDKNASSLVTTGGSESAILGLLAHKRQFQEQRGIQNPEVVMTQTVSPAYYRACEILGITIRTVPVDQELSVQSEYFEELINENTICIIASAPAAATGLFDPLSQVNDLAGKYNVGLFLDAGAGSLLLPFAKEAGLDLEEQAFDFTLENVTAINCDVHNYGLSPKGCSVLMFADREMQKRAYFALPQWCSTSYSTALLSDGRNAAVTAAAWAILMHFGQDGYAKITKQISQANKKVRTAIKKISEYEVIGNPVLGTISFRSTHPNLNIFELGNYLYTHEWQVSAVQNYPALSLTITPANIGQLDQLIDLLKRGSQSVKMSPGKHVEGPFAILMGLSGMANDVKRAVVQELMHTAFDFRVYKKDDGKQNDGKGDKKDRQGKKGKGKKRGKR